MVCASARSVKFRREIPRPIARAERAERAAARNLPVPCHAASLAIGDPVTAVATSASHRDSAIATTSTRTRVAAADSELELAIAQRRRADTP